MPRCWLTQCQIMHSTGLRSKTPDQMIFDCSSETMRMKRFPMQVKYRAIVLICVNDHGMFIWRFRLNVPNLHFPIHYSQIFILKYFQEHKIANQLLNCWKRQFWIFSRAPTRLCWNDSSTDKSRLNAGLKWAEQNSVNFKREWGWSLTGKASLQSWNWFTAWKFVDIVLAIDLKPLLFPVMLSTVSDSMFHHHSVAPATCPFHGFYRSCSQMMVGW
jgi:hypothetical protein